MIRFLVHCHVYYPHLWGELKSCLLNIDPCPFDLYVTMVKDHREIVEDIERTFPKAKIIFVENRGYDVAPFIKILNQVNLYDYDFVIKLHTKRDIPDVYCNEGFLINPGNEFRKLLLEFLASRKNFERVICYFNKNEKFGMHCPYKLIHPIVPEARDKTGLYIEERFGKFSRFNFVAGTIFICRAELLQGIKDLSLKDDDFVAPLDHTTHCLAYIIENLFGYFVYKNGYYIEDALHPLWKSSLKIKLTAKLMISKILRFFYQKKITKKGHLIIRVCRIPIRYVNSQRKF